MSRFMISLLRIATVLSDRECFTCFFSVDLSASYFQIPISEESQPLTCFMTPQGRFQMTWLSMGLYASSNSFNQ